MTYKSINLSVYLGIYLYIWGSICISGDLSVCLSIYLSVYLAIYPSNSLCCYLSIYNNKLITTPHTQFVSPNFCRPLIPGPENDNMKCVICIYSPCLWKSMLRRVASGDMSSTVGADSGRKACNRSDRSLSFLATA